MPRGKRFSSGYRLAFLLVTSFTQAAAGESTKWSETFGQGRLNLTHWQPTAAGDCRNCTVTVVNGLEPDQSDYRLQISADTRGTQDETVKFVGVRSRRQILITKGTQLSAELDWNNQRNGSYLSAALILSPHKVDQNPLKTSEWLKIEYVGVPPGQNVRMTINLAEKGQERILYMEGWPETNRTGRRIGRQKITVDVLNQQVFRISENAQLVYESKLDKIPFKRAYLYLQLSSHSNYANRSIYFDNIQVSDLTSSNK